MKIKEKIKFEKAAQWTGSSIISGEPGAWIENISTDTRTLRAGDFFIPVEGENFDGHDFIEDAVRAGAGGFVYERNARERLTKILSGPKKNGPGRLLILETEQSLDFLTRLAANYLRQFKAITIGITGSVGKTTTKNFIAGILSIKYNTVYTPGNFNTEIGVSKTIFNIGADTDYFIVELGMRGKNQIGPLAEISNVRIGAITLIGDSHMEFFKGSGDIAEAKAEIAGPVKKNGGKLFLNADDRMAAFIRGISGADIIEFGDNNGIDYNFAKTGTDKWGRSSFDLLKKDKILGSVKLGLPGHHNLYNGCLAAAICHYLGADMAMIKQGIENAKTEGHRMELLECSGITILDDCYNAGPLSVRCAIDTLLLISKKSGRRPVAILGDMLELGSAACGLHYEIGNYCAKKDIDVLIASGKLAKNIYRGFRDGINKTEGRSCFYFNDKYELEKGIKGIIEPGDMVLIKGSRANKMEDIISYFQ
ncbi:MAG: UDP-N-acetylmuramoyl-tripeptide--D-alanyl-D-alanine ligase [Actinomycetia bacterium]|nr:UDP-N-acetylmuramoyl-tripeptide--D-alanyl-D-alanine ligase [Actinomycetes bacterium]